MLRSKIESFAEEENIMEKVAIDDLHGEVFTIGNTRGEGAATREVVTCRLYENGGDQKIYSGVQDGQLDYISECANQKTARTMWKYHCKRLEI